jgi:FAD/FMN-containing dehydrogenase
MAYCTVFPLRSIALAALLEYDYANQVVTVEAGMSLTALQAILADQRQWLPLRPFLGMETTVGGMVALGACGPERLRYGAPRDFILGLRFVSGKGLLVSTGGKVVKNVAGYELGRLMVGSAGTLGFLTELTFRVSPMPELCRAVSACGSLETISTTAAEVLRSNMDPAFVTGMQADRRVEGKAIVHGRGLWRLTVGFEGFGETVNAQEKGCIGLLAGNGLEEQVSQEYSICNGMFAEHDVLLDRSEFLLRFDVPLDRVTNLVSGMMEAAGPEAIFVDFGCGRVRAALSGMPDGLWDLLCRLAERIGGHVLLEKATHEFKERHDVFGPERRTWRLMHRIKEALDPNNIFAPGRLPGRK